MKDTVLLHAWVVPATKSWLGLSLLLFASVAIPQEPAQELDTLTVTSTREVAPLNEVGRSISVVDARRIQQDAQLLGLDEALAGVPGLYMQNRYNFAQDLRVSLRGFGARSSFGIRGIKILVDGIPETLPDGQAGVDSIDLASAERIEVLRGPASSLYGNAAGGVIAITSELGSAAPALQMRGAYGEDEYSQLQLKSTGRWQAVDYLLSASRQELDGYREHAQARGSVFNSKFAVNLDQGERLLLSFTLTDQPQAQDPGGLTAEQAAANPRAAFARNLLFDAGENLQQQRLGAVYHKPGPYGTLTLRNYYVWRDFANKLPFEGGGIVQLDRFYFGGGAQYAFAWPSTAWDVSLGIDLDRQDDGRQRFDNLEGLRGERVFDQDEQVDALGVYVQSSYTFNDDWSLSAGLRYDELSYKVRDRFLADGNDSGRLTFEDVSPSLALNRRLGQGSLFASYSSSFETPTTTELANPDARGGFNPALEPQQADNFELGYKLVQGRVRGELAVFLIELKDELLPFELEDFPGRTFYSNAGRSSREGLEAAVAWTLRPGWQADLSYTWSRFEFEQFRDDAGNDFAGKQLPGLPEHFGYAGLSWQGSQGASARLEVVYAGRQYADNANSVSVSSSAVTNLKLGWTLRSGSWHWRPYLGVSNLLDETYFSNVRINAFGGRYFEPAPQRSVYAGVSAHFGKH